MKIAIITPGRLAVPPVNGGAVENLIFTLIKENEISSRPVKFDIYGIQSNELENYRMDEKYTNYYFSPPVKKEYKINNLNRLVRKIEKKLNYSYFLVSSMKEISKDNYDYVVVENRPNFVNVVRKYYNGRIILHMHNEHLTSDKNYQEAIDNCYKIFVVSNYIKNTILQRYKLDANKIEVVHNGIDTKKFYKHSNKEKMEIRERLGINQNDFLVLFSGRLTREKGILKLINAVENCKDIENLKLIIVGASWFSENKKDEFTESLINASKNISNKVIFTGYIDYEKVAKVYASADVAILPSIWNDPFPLTVLECMAVGLPIISTISGGIPEMVNDECGILLSVDDEIEKKIELEIRKLYKSKSEISKMGDISALRVRDKFNQENFYNNFIQKL